MKEKIETSIMKKRGQLDFSKHELITSKSGDLLVHYLKVPGTIQDSIKFINFGGILAVTGDYGNWIFCREFHPSANGMVSDSYWVQKLKISSTQNPYEFDSEGTEEEIKRMIDDEDTSKKWKDELTELLSCVDDEFEYTYKAYRETSIGSECVPHVKKLNYWLLVVFDAFEEICQRIKKFETEKEV